MESASETALSLLELLGWEVAKGEKLKGFADAFNMLGARISFAEMPRGLAMVSNKPGRLEDIEKLLGAMATRGNGSLDLIPSLKGKLLFAASHVFGKCSQIAIQAIRQCETGSGHNSVGSRPFLTLQICCLRFSSRMCCCDACLGTPGYLQKATALSHFGSRWLWLKPHSAQAAHKRAKSWGRGSLGFGSSPWLCFSKHTCFTRS